MFAENVRQRENMKEEQYIKKETSFILVMFDFYIILYIEYKTTAPLDHKSKMTQTIGAGNRVRPDD